MSNVKEQKCDEITHKDVTDAVKLVNDTIDITKKALSFVNDNIGYLSVEQVKSVRTMENLVASATTKIASVENLDIVKDSKVFNSVANGPFSDGSRIFDAFSDSTECAAVVDSVSGDLGRLISTTKLHEIATAASATTS